MTGFIKRQAQMLMQWVRSQPRLVAWAERILPELKKFVIGGPTLVGFILGIVRYAPGTVYFETAFQSLVIFLIYLLALTVAQAADSLFFSSWPLVLAFARSLLATAYLAITIRQFLQWRKGNPQILPLVGRIRERLHPLTGDAA